MSNRGANGAHNGVVVVSVQGVQKHLIVRVQFFKHHQPLIICGNLVDGLKRQMTIQEAVCVRSVLMMLCSPLSSSHCRGYNKYECH